ncbi:MAG: hypothetical protein R6X32_23185 [Chloroflexota bacterium]
MPKGQLLALLPLLLLALWQATVFSEQYSVNSKRYSVFTVRYGVGWFKEKGRWTAVLALLFALAILSHPVIYALMFPLGLWLLLLAWRWGWRVLIGPALGMGGGVLLSAFFWLPMLLEVSATRATTTAEQGYSYRDNFLTLGQLLDWPRLPADPALLNPPVVRALPLVALLLALLFLAGWLWRRGPSSPAQRQALLDWSLLLLVSTWLILPASRLVWDTAPLLSQVLFPWRFLTLASLAGAVLLGLALDLFMGGEENFNRREHGERRENEKKKTLRPLRSLWLIPLLITAVLVIAAVPWLFPPQEAIPEAPTRADLAATEQPPLFIGTTTLGEFLPRWVETVPDTAEMRAALLQERHFDRLQPLPELTVRQYEGRATDARYQIEVSRPLTLTYRQFYFPGWQATLNDQPLALSPGRPHGLIETAVPPGSHSLHIWFGTTPVRQVGGVISVLGLLLIVLAAGLSLERNGLNKRLNSRSFDIKPHYLLVWGLAALATWFLLATVENPLRRATLLPDGILGLPQITPLDYAGEIRLLTYEPQQISQPAGQPIPLTLYWQAQRALGVSYLPGVQVVDHQGVVWSREAARPYHWRFTAGQNPWPQDGYRMDPFEIDLLDGTPPGSYRFLVGLVREDTGQTIAAHAFGQIIITEPMRGERPLENGMIAPADPAGPGLTLLGTRLDRHEAAPGDPLRLTLLWQLDDPQAVPTDQIALTLQDEAGNLLWAGETAVAPTYPLAAAQPGDRLRTEVIMRLPASLPGGQHTWYAQLETAVWPIGSLTINEPERTFTPPELTHPLNRQLGDVATLLGAVLIADERAGTDGDDTAYRLPASVHLIWQAEAETAVSYRVFLHLMGPDGQLVAQSDGEPAQWQRPTTGWLPGEIIRDPHQLHLPDDLPLGRYTLLAGLYEPVSGERLIVEGEKTAVVVTTWTIADD